MQNKQNSSNVVRRRLSCLVKLNVIFKQDFEDAILEAMAAALDDIKIEILEKEVGLIIKECRFCPTIAEMRNRIIQRGYLESEGSPLIVKKIDDSISDDDITKYLLDADSYLDNDGREPDEHIPDVRLFEE